MREIPLTQGKVALVDDKFFEELSRHKWYAHCVTGGYWYAMRTQRNKKLMMHREILKLAGVEYGDHKDGNGLDNRLFNLRPATNSQNQANKGKRKDGLSSRYKGVSKHRKSWYASIRHMGKAVHLGAFSIESDAAHAYDARAIELFGEFARLNFPSI